MATKFGTAANLVKKVKMVMKNLPPWMKVADITEIHTPHQALRQCKDLLSEFFWPRPLIEEDDTSESARRLSEAKLPKTAGVIANKACAKLYGLDILQESIHDLKHNLTLFLGVKKL